LEENNINWQRKSVYHPESDRLAERYVQTILEKLRCSGATVRNNWEEKLKDITEVSNRTPLGIHGYTPEEKITNKCDIEKRKLKMIREQQRRDEKINMKQKVHTLRHWQQVLLDSRHSNGNYTGKLASKYSGPLKIWKKLSDTTNK
jgi:hypothetical protein